MKSATAVSMWQAHTLGVLTCAGTLGAVTMEWARELFHGAGNDAWLSVLLGSIVCLGLGGMLAYAVALHPDAQPGSVLVTALGPWVGGLLSLGFLCYTLAESARILRTAVELVHYAVLPRTPSWALVTLGLVITAAVLLGGTDSVLRYVFTLFWPSILLGVATLGLGFRFADWANFLPVLSRGAYPVVAGTGALIEPIMGLELGLVYLPCFLRRGVSTSGALKAVLGGTAGLLFLALYITVALLVGFGPYEVAELTWPVMETVRRTYLSGLFFERLDILFLTTLLIISTSSRTLYTHAAIETLRQTFSLRPRAWQVWACVVAVWAMALAPSSLAEMDWLRRQLLQPLGLFYILLVPLLLMGAGLVRRYRRSYRA